MQLERCYKLSDRVGIRTELFGGILYEYDRRRLLLLRSTVLVGLLKRLDQDKPLQITLEQYCREQSLPPGAATALAHSLEELERIGIIHQEPAPATPAPPAVPVSKPGWEVGSKYELLHTGLSAPLCLTWEVTYACNLHCTHCLSSSPRPVDGELSTGDARRLIDDLAALKVFYINIGGGEPLLRPDFLDLVTYCVARGVGVKFSTNGILIDRPTARRIATMDYVDVQISVDGATAAINDPIRGRESFARAVRAMELLAEESVAFKINTVVTRHNLFQLDSLYSMAGSLGAQLRLTRLRPSGRGSDVWSRLHLTNEQQAQLYRWLREHPDVLTADSFFHLSAFGEPVEGLNMCGAGRVVCSIDPAGNIYPCPFLLHPTFYAGNIRSQSLDEIWRGSEVFHSLRHWEVGEVCRSCNAFSRCHGGCLAVKFFNDIPLGAPDPECVRQQVEQAGALERLPAGPAKVMSL